MSFIDQRLWLIACIALGLFGCATKATPPASQKTLEMLPTATAFLAPSTTQGMAVALGVIKPAHSASLSFSVAGFVDTVDVQVGDQVTVGDLLIQSDTASLELSLQVARQEVYAQQAALNRMLAENTQHINQAKIALEVSQQELERGKAQNPSSNIAAARARVEELQFELSQVGVQNLVPEVAMAQVRLARAQSPRDNAYAEYQQVLDRPWEPQEVREGYAHALQQTEWDLQLAQAEINSVLAVQQAHTVGLSVLAAQIEAAQAELDQAISARQAHTITLDIMATRIKAAQLELDNLQVQSDLYQDESPTEAQARLQQAQLAVAEIERRIQQAQLRTPFDGTVLAVWVRPGDAIAAGQSMMVVANLERFYLETTDLSEFDLARVDVGQLATVSFDAFPDVTLAGHVSEIVLQEFQDDTVIYAVRVVLDELEPMPINLRWGMTGVVQITVVSVSPGGNGGG